MADTKTKAPFDPRGHLLYCPRWADLWEEHHGRDNLDEGTVRNLDGMRTPEKRAETRCSRCRIEGSLELQSVVAEIEAEDMPQQAAAADHEPTVDEVWQEFWRPLLVASGVVDLEAVKRELYDYRFLLGEVPLVYEHVSGGRISKPNTKAFEVIAAADERLERACEDAVAEAFADTSSSSAGRGNRDD